MISRFLPRDSRWRAALSFAICCAPIAGCAPETHYAGDGTGHANAPSSDPVAVSPRPSASTAPSAAAPAVEGLRAKSARPDARDARAARPRALLVTELQGLEQLAAVTPKSAPDHAQLLRRLAEDYVELERAAHADGAASIEKAARTKAIQKYSSLIADHPDYAQKDEATYYLAVEYEQAGDRMNARRMYLSLLERSPQSRFVPDAYLAFGEMFFDEAAQNPSKFALAASAYREVMKFPPPRNRVYGYACYKLGWALYDEGDSAGAVEAFKSALAFVTKFPTSIGAQKLRDAAREDLATLRLEDNAANPLNGGIDREKSD